MKTPFDKTFCTYLLATKNTRSVRIFYEFVNYLMPIREHSVSVLWKIWYIFWPIIYSYTLFFLFFFPYLLANNTLVCFSLFFGKACIIKKYTLNLSSKNISQYCKSPFLLYIYIATFTIEIAPLSRYHLDWILYNIFDVTASSSQAKHKCV